MNKEAQVQKMTDMMAKFVGYTGKKLPDDVIAKLEELRAKETDALPKVIYDTMFRNQELAVKLDRPSCQDTGVLQFWVKCGTGFPLINELEGLLKDAVNNPIFYGLHRRSDDGSWIFREWAPNATKIYLIGDCNNWKRTDAYALNPPGGGNWELSLPEMFLSHG